jgi:sugar-specific transcriptional regulator TrmB
MENETTPKIVSAIASSPTKFTAEEMKEIADIREGFDKAIAAFGKFYLQQRELKRNEERMNAELILMEKNEKEFLDKIVAKYGEGNYDPSTGIFTAKKKV